MAAVAAAPQGMVDDLLHLPMPAAEKVIRTVAVYLGILIVIRVAGKRLMAQMNSQDLVVVLLLSNVVQNAIIGADNSLVAGDTGPGNFIYADILSDGDRVCGVEGKSAGGRRSAGHLSAIRLSKPDQRADRRSDFHDYRPHFAKRNDSPLHFLHLTSTSFLSDPPAT